MAGSTNSDAKVVDPFGGLSRQQAGRYNQQFGRPFSQGFGFNPSERFENQLATRTAAGNPFAQFITNTRGLFAPLQADAARAGQEISTRAPELFQSYMNQAQGFLDQLPGFQSDVRGAQETVRAGVGQLNRAGQTLDRAEGAVDLGAGQYGIDRARQFLDEASSPIQAQALYQNALRQSTDAARQGAAGRGLLDAGSAQGREEAISRDLASQFAERRGVEQQNALAGYGGAQGVQQANVGLLGSLAGQRGGVAQGYGSLGATQGQLTALASELAQAGIPVTQEMLAMLPQYAQMLQAGSQLPFQTAQQIQSFLAAGQNPTLALAQATAPQVGQESKGFNFL